MKKCQFLKEACVENLAEAIAAERQGADQIELCSHLEEDGLSPGISLVEAVLKSINIPIKVMVRCRKGNFIYSDFEILEMQDYIKNISQLGIKEFVFGCLNVDHRVDLDNLKKLLKPFPNLSFTFHKAIDLCPDLIGSVRELSNFENISYVLTSGGENTAVLGRKQLKAMMAIGDKIKIIPAGKITDQNLSNLHDYLNAQLYHGRKIVGSLTNSVI